MIEDVFDYAGFVCFVGLPWIAVTASVLLLSRYSQTSILIGIFVSLTASVPFVFIAAGLIDAISVSSLIPGGCGTILFTPVLGVIIASITGAIGSTIGKRLAEQLISKNIGKNIVNIVIVVIGTISGALAGFLAAWIIYPSGC